MEDDYEHRICVVDSYPGSGKTSYAIQKINDLADDVKVIYITPYLGEVQRIIDSCPVRNFVQPDARIGTGSKMRHLIDLVNAGTNIVSTHALFTNTNDDLIKGLRNQNYILFLDEVFQTVEKWNIPERTSSRISSEQLTRQDMRTLIAKEIITVEDDYSIRWLDEDFALSQYAKLKTLADRGLLYLVGNDLLMWSFPVEVFRDGIFSKIYILTHMFEAQLQSYYYNYFKIDYQMYQIIYLPGNSRFAIEKIARYPNESLWRNHTQKKIHIEENHKINRIGDIYYDKHNRAQTTALSVSWYFRNKEALPTLKNNIHNYFGNITKSKANQRLWTCFNANMDDLKGKTASANYHIPINARATNDYGDKTVLAYMVNRYLDPSYNLFFENRGQSINEDKFALSEILQWIFRSAIRNDQDIRIYIPSERMRNLLANYLNS
ncbi:MAG TPA: hypothetical protein VMX17_00645 [Candidatus Glassbacteria bacterium]|nr:hypothetical protein [Candidatus Glassbacteria bacterium]